MWSDQGTWKADEIGVVCVVWIWRELYMYTVQGVAWPDKCIHVHVVFLKNCCSMQGHIRVYAFWWIHAFINIFANEDGNGPIGVCVYIDGCLSAPACMRIYMYHVNEKIFVVTFLSSCPHMRTWKFGHHPHIGMNTWIPTCPLDQGPCGHSNKGPLK